MNSSRLLPFFMPFEMLSAFISVLISSFPNEHMHISTFLNHLTLPNEWQLMLVRALLIYSDYWPSYMHKLQ